MASPASTSPPTVLSRNSTPSISSVSSSAASSGMTCSYFVAFVVFGSTIWPSICPTIVRQWIVPRLFLIVVEPRSTIGWIDGCSLSVVGSLSLSCVGFILSVIATSPFSIGFARFPKTYEKAFVAPYRFSFCGQRGKAPKKSPFSKLFLFFCRLTGAYAFSNTVFMHL